MEFSVTVRFGFADHCARLEIIFTYLLTYLLSMVRFRVRFRVICLNGVKC